MRKPRRAPIPLVFLALIAGLMLYFVVTGTSFDTYMEEHAHVHRAPNGGTLIVLGMHSAHIELVLDSSTGQLDLYPFDGHAVHPYSLPAEPLALGIRLDGAGNWDKVELLPSRDPNERPTQKSAYRFTARIPSLVGKEQFQVRIPALELAGKNYAGVETSFPEGNE